MALGGSQPPDLTGHLEFQIVGTPDHFHYLLAADVTHFGWALVSLSALSASALLGFLIATITAHSGQDHHSGALLVRRAGLALGFSLPHFLH